MKLIIKEDKKSELTVTVVYPEYNERVKKIIDGLKREGHLLSGNDNGRMYQILISDIYYIESVQKKVFIYTAEHVYASSKRLLELEKELMCDDFVKVSKTCLVNINKLVRIRNIANSRIEAELKNGEKIIISRTYIKSIRKVILGE